MLPSDNDVTIHYDPASPVENWWCEECDVYNRSIRTLLVGTAILYGILIILGIVILIKVR